MMYIHLQTVTCVTFFHVFHFLCWSCYSYLLTVCRNATADVKLLMPFLLQGFSFPLLLLYIVQHTALLIGSYL